jgi:hypothetical protein
VRDKSSVILVAVLAAFALSGLSAVVFSSAGPTSDDRPTLVRTPSGSQGQPAAAGPATSREWLASMRPYCNPIDIVTQLAWSPAPEGAEGTMHEAACLALAGRTDDARARLLTLSGDDRTRGAGVVFAVGHPAADAGDDVAAGPLMELVVEFWPNHYMALYHAGAARFEAGDSARASEYLERFLKEYTLEDGWRSNARTMLLEIGG